MLREEPVELVKLTVRVPRDLLANAKSYAAQNNNTLSNMIEVYLSHIPTETSLENAPITRRLSGTLSQNVSIDDYKAQIEEKYGQ
jgi:hypothetical protein